MKHFYIFLLSLLALVSTRSNAQVTNIDIGTGTSTSDNSPIQRNKNYSASELLYLSSEINFSGNITGLGFYKASGVNTVTIDSVYIYVKTTSATAVTSPSSTAGYTLAYKGAFPNNATGWLTVNFNMITGFSYNPSMGNLSVLTVRPYQASTTSRPYWRYSTGTTNRNGWYADDNAAWSGAFGSISTWRPNTRLIFTQSCTAPTALQAGTITSSTAALDWTQAGTPTGYQIKYGPAGFPLATSGTTVYTVAKPYTLNPPLSPATSYDYYVRAICGVGDTSAWSAVKNFTTLCQAPSILSATGDSICTSGSVTLSATASPGATLNWYSAATGGTSLGTGSTYITPSISTTTTYYAGAANLASMGQVGRSDYTGIAQAVPNNTGQGIRFNALNDFNLDSVAVWVVSDTGTIIIQLQNSANTAIANSTFTFSGTGATATNRIKIFLPVNYNIPAGSNYKILAMSGTTVSLSREQAINPTFSNYSIPNVITLVSSWVSGATNAANYYFFYNLYVSSGCINPNRTAVIATVMPGPVVNLGSDINLCPGNNHQLNATSAMAGVNYLWNTGATTPMITANAAGTYSVTVSNGICNGKDTIIVNSAPVPTANLADTVNICAGQTATLDAGNPGAAFSWNNSATTQTLVVNTGGQYKVTVTNSFNCSTKDSSYVSIKANPVVDLGNDTIVCPIELVTLDAQNPGAAYSWNTGATSQSIVVNQPGTYTVTVTNASNCSSSDVVEVTHYDAVSVDGFNFVPRFDIAEGTIEFYPINPQLVESYYWDFGDGDTSSLATPTHKYNNGGNYLVKLRVTNECSTKDISLMIHIDFVTGVVTTGNADLQVNVYPVPASQHLNIDISKGVTLQTIRVMDFTGKEIMFRPNINNSHPVIDLNDLAAGNYFIYIETDKGNASRKFSIIK